MARSGWIRRVGRQPRGLRCSRRVDRTGPDVHRIATGSAPTDPSQQHSRQRQTRRRVRGPAAVQRSLHEQPALHVQPRPFQTGI